MFLKQYCDIVSCLCTYTKVPEMLPCVPNKWSCGMIFSQLNTRLRITFYMKVLCTMNHEQLRKTVIGSLKTQNNRGGWH